MKNLRPYQLEAVDKVFSDFFTKNNVLLTAATGAGKTEIMIALIDRVLRSKSDFKCCVLLNKVDLLDQTIRRFYDHFKGRASISEFCGTNNKKDLSGNIVIATIQSIAEIEFQKLHLTVIDECHGFNFSEGLYKDFLDRNPCKVLGLTATPYNNRGFIYGKGKFFDEVSYSIGILELIESGFLVRPFIKEPDEKFDTQHLSIKMGDFDPDQVRVLTEDVVKVTKQVQDAIQRLVDRKKAVWACTSIDHAELVYSLIPEKKAIIHSKLTREERLDNLKSFKEGDAKHLVFITIVSEGFDYPQTDAVVLMRPTRSANLYVQTVGRAIRIAPDKKNALILDYGEVVRNCGPLNKPWIRGVGRALKSDKLKEKTAFKLCPTCHEILDRSAKDCIACGFSFLYDKIKNVRIKPDTAAELIDQKESKILNPIVTFGKHKSSNGNDCLKITYSDPEGGLVPSGLSEYFVLNNEYAKKKLNQRLNQLFGQDYWSIKFDNLPQLKPKISPTVCVWEHDGKYKKIKRLDFS